MEHQTVYDHVVSCVRSGTHYFSKGEIYVRCPSCGIEEGHFSVNSANGMYNCFKCHVSGSIIAILSRHRKEWLSLLRTYRKTGSPEAEKGTSLFVPCVGIPVSTILENVPADKKSLEYINAAKAMRYCLKRGMTRKQIKEYRVFTKQFDSRVYFPYWDGSGNTTFWMGRATNETAELKTIEMDGSQKPLFGRHIKVNRNEAVLVEGVFDHFVTPSSYAIMGSGVTSQQIVQLRNDDVKCVFLILDPDAGKQMQNVAKKLANFRFNVFPIVLEGGKDPAQLGRDRMTSIVRTAKRHHPVRPQPIYFRL